MSAGNSSECQRRRLLAALEKGPVTTLDARRDLNILMPATRVFELRDKGFNIITNLISQQTDSGVLHRKIAQYVMMPAENPA